MIRLDARVAGDLQDGHRSLAGQKFRENTFVPGIEVLDQHKSHSRVGPEVPEKIRECFKTASGSADANHREVVVLTGSGPRVWRFNGRTATFSSH